MMGKRGFKWQNFIEVSDEWGEQERADIIATLDQIEPLHLMQETLRDIPLTKLYDWQSDKVLIKPRDISKEPTAAGMPSFGYQPLTRSIDLPHDLKMNDSYKDSNGKNHNFSLTGLLFHEFQHTIDPEINNLIQTYISELSEVFQKNIRETLDILNNVNEHKEYLESMAQNPKIGQIMGNRQTKILQTEHTAVGRVNPTMEHFFNEPPRAGYIDFNSEENEHYKLSNAQGNESYEKNPSTNVNQTIGTPLKDIEQQLVYMKESLATLEKLESPNAGVLQEHITWQEKVRNEVQERTKQNFPGGNSRPF